MAQKNLSTFAPIDSGDFTTTGSFVVIQDGETRLLTREELKEIADLIASANITASAVTNAKIADGAVTTTKLASSSVDFSKLQSGAVQESAIGTGAVTAGKIGTNAVTDIKINALAVTEAKIAAGAVTNTKIGDNAVTTAKTNAVAYGLVGYGDTGGGLTSFGAVYTGNQSPSFTSLNGSNYFTATASGYNITFTGATGYIFSATQRRTFGDVGYTSTNIRNLAVETLTDTVRIIVLNGDGNPTTLDQTNDWCFNLVGIRQNA